MAKELTLRQKEQDVMPVFMPASEPFFPHTILPNRGLGHEAMPFLPSSPLGSYAIHAHPTLVTQSREGSSLNRKICLALQTDQECMVYYLKCALAGAVQVAQTLLAAGPL